MAGLEYQSLENEKGRVLFPARMRWGLLVLGLGILWPMVAVGTVAGMRVLRIHAVYYDSFVDGAGAFALGPAMMAVGYVLIVGVEGPGRWRKVLGLVVVGMPLVMMLGAVYLNVNYVGGMGRFWLWSGLMAGGAFFGWPVVTIVMAIVVRGATQGMQRRAWTEAAVASALGVPVGGAAVLVAMGNFGNGVVIGAGVATAVLMAVTGTLMMVPALCWERYRIRG